MYRKSKSLGLMYVKLHRTITTDENSIMLIPGMTRHFPNKRASPACKPSELDYKDSSFTTSVVKEIRNAVS